MTKDTNDITPIVFERKIILEIIMLTLLTFMNLTIVPGFTFSDILAYNGTSKISVIVTSIVTIT